MSITEPPYSIAAVVVLYWPDQETISFIEELNRGGWWLIAVVNSIDDQNMSRLNQVSPRNVIYNDQNLGLAYALNQGCERAFQSGATHVLLLDQDSRPGRNLPSDLLGDLISLTSNGHAIGAIGPKLVDVKDTSDEEGSAEKSLPPFETVNTLATSGSLVSRSAFEAVGKMYEWLFIDDIDHEWCFRAKHKGFKIVRSNLHVMQHNMGDVGVTLFGRYRPLHRSPIRHYYITRNTFFLARHKYVPWRWRLSELLKMIYRIPVYIMFSSKRVLSLKMIFRAVIDGVLQDTNNIDEAA